MNKTMLTTLFLLCSLTINAQIYKYTDENGNIHYTDQKPFEGAKQEQLKPLTIIRSSDEEPVSNWRRQRHKDKFSDFKFDNFIITSPKQDETLWGTGGNVAVSVFIDGDLPDKYRIKFYLDDLPHGKVKSNSQLIADVVRGEHSIYATVIDTFSRRVVKTSPKVKFHLKQHSKK